ncbi:MAG: Maf family protein [Eubacterium sp.]|nr:Maf family protein [Eubacterium sp.]
MRQKIQIILASNSPRRRELLKQAGLEFQIITNDIQEKTEYTKPSDVVLDLSEQKAGAVSDIFIRKTSKMDSVFSLQNDEVGRVLVVGADTVVALDEKILGKPKNIEEAKDFLMRLSGRSHEVYTGVSCKFIDLTKCDKASKDNESDSDNIIDNFSFYVKTEVKMFSFNEYEALDYIATGEPMDKAGAYGIQGIGSRLVESINGDYNNVVGFPLSHFIRELSKRKYIEYY